MLIAARNAMMAGGGKPSAKDYVQSGLVEFWDGIENAGWGVHDANATEWTGLISGNILSSVLATGGSITANANNFACNKAGLQNTSVRIKSLMQNDMTIRLVLSIPTNTDYIGGAAFGYAGNVAGLKGINGYRFRGNFYWAYQDQPTSITKFNAQQIYVLDFVVTNGSECKFYADSVYIKTQSYAGSQTVADNIHLGYIGNVGNESVGNYHLCQIYNRALTAAEIAANYAVDKARFGLP